MKKIKTIILLSLFSLVLSACSTVKEGFKNQKKDNTDEFLVEKKAPLVMPPNYNELPIPKDKDVEDNDSSNEVKKLITDSKNSNTSERNTDNSGSSLEDKILGKIKK